MIDETTPTPGRSRSKRLTIAGLVTVGLASGGAVAASAAAASGSGSEAGTSRSTPAAPPVGPGVRGPMAASKYDLNGTVTAASSKSLTVRSLFGVSREYGISSKTVFHAAPGKTVSASVLQVGDHAVVHGQKESGSLVADDIDIHAAHIDGAVTAVSGNAVTVTDPDGFTRQISLSSGTTFTVDGAKSSISSVRTGRVLHAMGAVDTNGTTLDASSVAILASAPKPGVGPTGRPLSGPAAPPAPGTPRPPREGKNRPPAGAAPQQRTTPSGAQPAPTGTPSAPNASGAADGS